MANLYQTNATQVKWMDDVFHCRVGWGGFAKDKEEGDGCTPVGMWKLQTVYFRPDKIRLPDTKLPWVEITQDMVWSDDPTDLNYNTCIHMPYSFIKTPPFSHERLWREDNLYDVLITTSHNTNPVVPGDGSAIFIHQMHDEMNPTAGCLALELRDLLFLIETVTPETYWVVGDHLARAS